MSDADPDTQRQAQAARHAETMDTLLHQAWHRQTRQFTWVAPAPGADSPLNRALRELLGHPQQAGGQDAE
jgi:hypothetical protein